jgi:beta-N-acetylhexosaminidase
MAPASTRGNVSRGAASATLTVLCALLVLAGCGSSAPTTGRALGPRSTGTATAAASPTTSPSQTPVPHAAVGSSLYQARLRATADAYLARMTLDEKLGQMFLVETCCTGYNSDTDYMVRNLHAGAMILYYPKNLTSLQQVHDYVAAIQAHADLPLLVTMDEEGGVVDRLRFVGDPALPAAQDLAASGDPHQAWEAGARAASEMQALGINTDLAPVADVRTIPNAIEWTRLFGDDPATVDRYASQFLLGLQQNGEIGCVKHWPGIGSTSEDPHLTLPTITRSRAELESTEFAAFRNLLALQPGMIMVTHVVVQAIDPTLPATLSPAVVQGVLRGELGYDGVVMTDSLYMNAIWQHYSLGEAGVLSVIAGDDLLEGAWSSDSMTLMLNALHAAISQGRISPARIDQSVRRILMLKARFGLLPSVPPHAAGTTAGAPGIASALAELPRPRA